jgi:hypothetical protein
MTAVEPIPSVTRPGHLRIARLHLRLGTHELARAELEAAAGDGSLDEDALLDLAEVRWRTGDLPGAGVAANAYLSSGLEDVLGLVIAAEAAGAAGHSLEARQLAARTLEAIDADPATLDRLFAGAARGAFWPLEPGQVAGPAVGFFDEHVGASTEPPADAAAAEAVVRDGSSAGPGGAHEEGPGLWADDPSPPADGSTSDQRTEHAAVLLAARAALESGDHATAADRLSELIRSRPDLASSVLAALDARDEDRSARAQEQPPTDEPRR